MNQPAATADTTGARAYRGYVLIALLLLYTLNFVDRVLISILAPPIKAQLHLSDTQLGFLGGTAFALFYTALGIPIGRLADRMNRVGILTGALALWSLFTALCGFASNFAFLFFARLGVGVGEAGGVAPAYALIADYFAPGARGRAYAVFSMGVPCGSALGLLLGGYIAAIHGWRTAFISVGIAGLLLAPLLALTVQDPWRRAPSATGVAKLAQVLAQLVEKPSFWLLSLGAAFGSLIGYGLVFWLPSFFLRNYGMSLLDVSRVLGAITFFGGICGLTVGGYLVDRFGPRDRRLYAWLPAVAYLGIIPCYALATTRPWGMGTLLLYLVPAALQLVWLGPIVSAIQQLVPSGMRAAASAIFLFINNLIGLGLGSLLLGFVSDQLGPHYGAESLRYAILAGTGFYVLAAALLLLAAPRLSRDAISP